jgi:ABC-2 type transport system ATP-binding protein
MISVRGLRKSYGGREVLRGIDLVVGAGERVALVGPNGSGKTTLMRCLLGLVGAGGTVRIDGLDPVAEHEEAQRRVAYVPQRAPLLPIPLGELTRFWAAVRRRPIAELEDVTAEFALPLPLLLGQDFSALSGGMQQKLLAGMALAARCPVLRCDEPTANLDPAARDVFLRRLASMSPRPTIVLTSHRLAEVRAIVDRVVVLDEGRIAFDDALDRFLADPGLAQAAGLDERPQPMLVPAMPRGGVRSAP